MTELWDMGSMHPGMEMVPIFPELSTWYTYSVVFRVPTGFCAKT